MSLFLPPQPQHDDHSDHGNPWLLGGLAAVTAVSLAPFVLPMLGIGDAAQAGRIMHSMPGAEGSLAMGLQGMLGSLPFGIGEALTSTATVSLGGFSIATGTLVTLGATATIGIGGVLLANWMEKNERPGDFPWSKVIRWTAIGTSALIALPGILGALSIGITFMASLFNNPGLLTDTFGVMHTTLGATEMHAAGGALGGAAASLMHLLDCGVASLPLIGAYFADKSTDPGPRPLIHQYTLTPGGAVLGTPQHHLS